MKKLLITLLATASISSFAVGVTPQIESQIRTMLPNTKITAINYSTYAGLYEVLAGDNAFYVGLNNESEVIVGHILNIKTMQDETQINIELANAKRFDYKSMDLSKTLKVGKGKKHMVVFIDPDCPYCQQLEAYLNTKLDKITVHYVFIPLPMHPNAAAHTRQILCSSNPAGAVFDLMVNHKDLPDGSEACQANADKTIKANEDLARANGINSTPYAVTDTNKVIGGFNQAAFDKFIEGK